MRKRKAHWTLVDRLVFAACYGILGLFLGLVIALFIARYLSTSFNSSMVIVMIGSICTIMGFIAPNIISQCFNKFWIWLKYWWI